MCSCLARFISWDSVHHQSSRPAKTKSRKTFILQNLSNINQVSSTKCTQVISYYWIFQVTSSVPGSWLSPSDHQAQGVACEGHKKEPPSGEWLTSLWGMNSLITMRQKNTQHPLWPRCPPRGTPNISLNVWLAPRRCPLRDRKFTLFLPISQSCLPQWPATTESLRESFAHNQPTKTWYC